MDSLMNTDLRERCLRVLQTTSVNEFSNEIVSFARSLGFRRFAATVITDHSVALTEFQTVTNAPPAFLNDFHDLDKAKLDPVSQHCKHSSTPIVWCQRTYVAEGMGDYWDTQASHGYKQGIAIALHFLKGRHFMIGASGDHSLPNDRAEAERIVRSFQLFAAHAQAAAFDFCLPPRSVADARTSLTGRELDALRWAMDGKTARGVATAMATSEEIAVLRLQTAMRKLNCGSRYEAILKAIRLGLIRCD
jgi:DNA-binding CsgD family transcriptional regulator